MPVAWAKLDPFNNGKGMRTRGTGVFADDLACDVRDAYRDLPANRAAISMSETESNAISIPAYRPSSS